MISFELPKPSILSADSSTGSSIVFHSDSGFLSRSVQREEKPKGEAARVATYRLGVLPSGLVLASYDVHLPAGTTSISVYENGDEELGADFSVQASDWSREQIVAEAVFGPQLQSTVVRSSDGYVGCTVHTSNNGQKVELFELNPDKSIRSLQSVIGQDGQVVLRGIRIRHNEDHLFVGIDDRGYKSGVRLPFMIPNESFKQMHEVLQQPHPLEFDPQEIPIPMMGAAVRFAHDDIYRV